MKHSEILRRYNQCSEKILECAYEVHTALGPGLLEHVYQRALQYELNNAGLIVDSEVNMPLRYKSIEFEVGYRIDLLVENTIVVEIKAVDKLLKTHKAQTLTYLKIGNYPLGLLLNFNEMSLKYGIKRIINTKTPN